MRLSRNAARDVRRLVLDVVLLDGEQDAAPSLEDMARRAKALLDGPFKEDHRRASRRKDRGPRAPGESKAAKREDRAARTAEIRAACVARADGKCEVCEQPENERFPTEMHHLLMGRGRRTQDQDVSNCIMVCPVCHAVGHGRILQVGDVLIEWSRKHGYAETERAIRYRIDKALLADRTWPRDEDETRRLGPAVPKQEGGKP